MRLVLMREWTPPGASTVFGKLIVSTPKGQYPDLWTCERHYNNNKPGKSAVPPGFYKLEAHDGQKYKKTLALIGASVDHYDSSDPHVSRTACVFHKASKGDQLQGCIAMGTGVVWDEGGYHLYGTEEGRQFKKTLRTQVDRGHAIYLTIINNERGTPGYGV